MSCLIFRHYEWGFQGRPKSLFLAQFWDLARHRITGCLLQFIALSMGLLAAFWLALTVRVQHVANPVDLDPQLSGNWVDRIVFESTLRLVNDSSADWRMRFDCLGLTVWLLVICALFTWMLFRHERLLTRGLAYCWLSLLLLLLTLWPKAFAYAHWGISYPRVQFTTLAECTQSLCRQLSQPGCCLFDVTAGGDRVHLFVRLPDGTITVHWVTDHLATHLRLDSRSKQSVVTSCP